MSIFSKQDEAFMRLALEEAEKGLGRCAPNPSVGCVIVDPSSEIVGKARTTDGGRPHAEIQALQQVGERAKGATAYATLEPCSHHGVTAPCSDALTTAGLKRVVIAALDPDPRVSGRGVERLKSSGIQVDTGLFEEEATKQLLGHILRQTENRPLVTLKIASSLDGKIALANGESKWITGEDARYYGHVERSKHDAILVGSGTALADNPSLTTRLEGIEHKITRIVFDTNLRLDPGMKLFQGAKTNPLWIFCAKNTDQERQEYIQKQGAEIFISNLNQGAQIDVSDALCQITKAGITRLLVEGGPSLTTSFIRLGLFDRIIWFKNHSLLGNEGRSGIDDLGLQNLDQRISLKKVDERVFDGHDTLEVFEKL